ncbi:MAG: hypothetical protein D8M54_12045 [Chloroflexi bacterium]|nr:hypothetical protein [Chloroflexota bacterium]
MMPPINPIEDGMSDELETPPQLFVLRLWQTLLPDGRREWRGRLHHAQTNETRYFRDWPALIPSLLAMLPPADQPPDELTRREPPEQAT